MLRIGYFSLPVVGLTGVFIGAALALNIYIGGARFNAEQIRAEHRRARHHARTWARARGPDARGPRQRRHRRRDRHDARDRTDRRDDDALDRSVPLPDRPARAGGDDHAADPGSGRRHYRRDGRLSRRRESAWASTARSTSATRSTIWSRRTSRSASSKPPRSASSSPVVGAYQGYKSKGGALGVGRAATNAVVAAAVLILAANYLITAFWV